MTKSKPILLSVFDISDPEFGEALMAVVERQAGATLDVADIRKRAASAIALGSRRDGGFRSRDVVRSRRHSGLGRTCDRLALVANDPLRKSFDLDQHRSARAAPRFGPVRHQDRPAARV
jgi:hypothetical protein